jgi:type I restriction enzyme, S subunit
MKNSWQTKTLGEVCEIGAGNSAPQKKEMFEGGEYPFFRTSDVGKIHLGIIYDSVDMLNQKGIEKLKLFPQGTLLFPKSGASTFLNHRVLMGVNGYVSSHLATIKAKEKYLLDSFLYYYSRTIDSRNLMQDQNYPSLRLSDISNIEINFPSLEEQKAIVKILDEVFESISKSKENAEKNLKNAKELFESYLEEIFSNPKEGWEEKKLGEICEFIRGPFGGSLKKSFFKDEGYAVYEQRHAIYDQFDNIRYFVDEKKFNEMKRFELFPGDLIMSCSGTMGKIAIAPKNIKRGIINQALLKLSTSKKVSNLFLKLWMESSDFQRKIREYSLGAAIQNVASVKILKEIGMKLPTIQEQKLIVQKLDTLSKEIKQLEEIYKQKLKDLEELKKSMLQKAFSGELTKE